MIELRGICSSFGGRPVIRDVSLSFVPGRVLVLLGPNGCGKSTLLRTVLGLQPCTSGQVLFDGADGAGLTPRRIAQQVSYLAQARTVPNITVNAMVLHGRFPYLSFPRRYRAEDRAAAQQALARMGVEELAGRPLQELSGGQRQKVYLAMTLAQDTQTVLLDEPTTYLDVRHQLEVLHVARQLAQQGKAVVLVLHDLCMALRLADEVALMWEGRLLQCAPPEEIYESGALGRVFGVEVRRVQTGDGWQYYCV